MRQIPIIEGEVKVLHLKKIMRVDSHLCRVCGMSCLLLLLLVPAFIQQAEATIGGSDLWYGYSGVWQTPSSPETISSTIILTESMGNKWIKAALVVTVHEYNQRFTDYGAVNIRVNLYFDSFANEYLIPVPAEMVAFHIEKDTDGSDLDKQKIEVLASSATPGYSQGNGLHQTLFIDSENKDRLFWGILEALGFAVGLFSEPIEVAISLIGVASAFLPQGGFVDFRDAGYEDYEATSWWQSSGDFGWQNPVQQYCLNSITWIHDKGEPSTYFGLKIWAGITLPMVDNPFGVQNFATPPVYLRIYNNKPNTPSRPYGPPSGFRGVTYTYSTSATDPNGDNVRYEFDWGDGTPRITTDWCASGDTRSASHSWSSTGIYQVTARAQDTDLTWSGWSSGRTVSITSGGGGCPYLSTWNGKSYVLDNNLLPTSRLGDGSDVEDYYVLEKPLVQRNGRYPLVISEFENEHDYLDQVKLLAVDHGSDVKIAVTPEGEILTYRNPAPPVSCVDSNGTDRLSQICYIDGDFSDPATYFQGNENDYMLLNFGRIRPGNAKLIVRNDMLCMDKCILVQVKEASGEWQTIEVIASRATWSTEGVNLSLYVVEGQDLTVRLFWTQPHKLDYVGLDTTPQDPFEVRYATLVSATHLTQGNVRAFLSKDDNMHAELIPGQQIELEFTLPNEADQVRTYILYVEGHYDSMAP